MSCPGNKSRPFDKSQKPFEVLRKEYDFDIESRALISCSIWKHLRYYDTMKGVRDAIVAARSSWHARYTKDGKLRITRYKGRKR